MGVRLDWQIESERAHQRAGEDPEEKRHRRRMRTQMLIFVAIAIAFVCAIGALVWYRLYTVDQKLRQDLISTVQAETAALRIGDLGGFLAIQRTAPGGSWYDEQTARFKRYQELKTKSDVKLTGNVLNVDIDEPRGRAMVEEVVDGVSFQSVWFYWRYGDGWRHVPSDYTFWGDAKTITGQNTTVNYHQLDSATAQSLAARVERWWTEGCGYLGCKTSQKLEVDILADPIGQPRWDEANPNTLLVPSPLSVDDRTRTDVSLPEALEDTIAAKLADRLFDIATGNLRPIPTADAAWLRQVTVDWVAAAFTGRGDTDRHSFVQSLRDHYGPQSLVSLVQALSPSSDISVVGSALRLPLEGLALDWRTFFQRRLDVEKVLISRNDIPAFQSLWDAANPQALEQMRLRLSHPTQATPQVQSVAVNTGTDGVPRAQVQVTAEGKAAVVIFRLVNGAWKRSA